MTVVIAQTEVNGFYISCEVERSYKVSVCPMYQDSLCGYPIRQNTYAAKSKAMATYRRYVKEFSNV